MARKGVRIYNRKRVDGLNVEVGFYYYELILAYLAKPNYKEMGRRLSQIAVDLKLPYSTVRSIVYDLHKMNRLMYEKRIDYKTRQYKYWRPTIWAGKRTDII